MMDVLARFQAQGLGDVRDAGVALGAFEIEDAFEIILHAFGHSGAVMRAAFAGSCLSWDRRRFGDRLGHGESYVRCEHV